MLGNTNKHSKHNDAAEYDYTETDVKYELTELFSTVKEVKSKFQNDIEAIEMTLEKLYAKIILGGTKLSHGRTKSQLLTDMPQYAKSSRQYHPSFGVPPRRKMHELDYSGVRPKVAASTDKGGSAMSVPTSDSIRKLGDEVDLFQILLPDKILSKVNVDKKGIEARLDTMEKDIAHSIKEIDLLKDKQEETIETMTHMLERMQKMNERHHESLQDALKSIYRDQSTWDKERKKHRAQINAIFNNLSLDRRFSDDSSDN